MKTILKITLFSGIALILSACGGTKDEWGIDYQGGGTLLVNCSNNAQDAVEAKAVLLPAGTKIRKLSQGTVLRIWHFQNSVEAACTVSGKAIILTNNEG
jgi:hypothetical protein